MENKAYQIVKGKNCNAADVATFLDNIKQALMLVWDDFDRLKVTPNNYDLNYIVNDLALTQFKEFMNDREIELTKKVLDVIFSQSDILYEKNSIAQFILDDLACIKAQSK